MAKKGKANVQAHHEGELGDLVLERQRPLCGRGCVLWMTGLSGSGKSTIARALEKRLMDQGRLTFVLDGDTIRKGLSSDLGFSQADRQENIRRVAEVAALFADAGLIAITACISPYRSDRAQARRKIGSRRFLEIFVDAPLEVCRKRDPKGLYEKAYSGMIDEFTGLSAPYEHPPKPELVLPTHLLTLEECVERVLSELRVLRLIFC